MGTGVVGVETGPCVVMTDLKLNMWTRLALNL